MQQFNNYSSLGYDKPLYILPFDHRSSFARDIFGLELSDLTESETEKVKEYKKIIYDAFKMAVAGGIAKTDAAILVDEQFGDEILKDAADNGFNIILTVEKSGQKEFDFEYGHEFGNHIKKYNPTFAKALVRRPVSDVSIEKLKKLSDFCHEEGYKLLIELLVENEGAIRLLQQFQEEEIEPDGWKIEGMENESDYQKVVEQATTHGRENVGVVVLGRGEEKPQVEKWITTAAKVNGIIGFAIGRTIFLEPLIRLNKNEIEREEAKDIICKNFLYFYNIFVLSKKV